MKTENTYLEIVLKIIDKMNVTAVLISLLFAIYCKNTSIISKSISVNFEPMEEFFIALITCYLIIGCFLRIGSKVKTEYIFRKNEASVSRKNDLISNRMIDEFKGQIDKMPKETVNYLRQFYQTRNASITIRYLVSDPYLVDIQWADSRTGYDDDGRFVKMILKDNIYHLLKQSVEQDGKLGHFEDIGIE